MLDEFAIRPPDGDSFDVTSLLARLRSLPNAVELPAVVTIAGETKHFRENEFVICSTPERAKDVLEKALDGSGLDAFYGTIALVLVKPNLIWTNLLASPAVIDQVRDLLMPILRKDGCRIFSETGEVTAKYGDAPERLFDM